jgi:glycosyltransferase involved in cell wall biosynthesis
MELKTSFQLANERVIASSYAKELEVLTKKRNKIEQEYLENTPDLVVEWEKKQKEWENLDEHPEKAQDLLNKPIEDVIKSPSKLIIKQKNAEKTQRVTGMSKLSKVASNQYLVPVVDPEVVKYNNIPEVYWYGHFTSYSGFSRMNRAMVFGLSNRGVRVKVDIEPSKVEINKATQKELELLSNLDINTKAPKIYGATIPITMIHSGRKILYTMMETSETLHKNYVDKINLFNEVWVPTHYGAKMFKKNGVLVPIYVMPLGVDIERYNEQTEPYKFEESLNKFVFISVFKWGYRKGYDILLKANLDEFSSNDDVSLLLLTRCDTDPNPTRISEDIAFIRSGIDKRDEQLPHVAVYSNLFPEKDMPKIYRAADAFVLISRGEGFGLPYLEAAACGLPIIASNCSGQSDFLNKENSFLVDPDAYTQAKVNGNMSKLAKHCLFYENQTFPEFGEKAIQKTREYMREIFKNKTLAKKKTALLTKETRKNYSWEKAVDNVLLRIKDLME